MFKKYRFLKFPVELVYIFLHLEEIQNTVCLFKQKKIDHENMIKWRYNHFKTNRFFALFGIQNIYNIYKHIRVETYVFAV